MPKRSWKLPHGLDQVSSAAGCKSFKAISRHYLLVIGLDNSISKLWQYPEILNLDD
jgi:hypothetical protein